MAISRISVGRSSSRTPFKHWILNAELGRLCGIFGYPSTSRKVHAKANPFLVVDLCAGDGGQTDEFKSSPEIIKTHLEWARKRGVDVKCVLIERQASTFDLLRKNIPSEPWIEFIQGDAREYLVECKTNQAVFIHSDPNHIHDWPITDDLLSRLSDTTTMLATLGCNVGGLKMLPIEERGKWYENMASCVKEMPRYHDGVLVALDGDAAQWAYFLRVPVKWSANTCANIMKSGAKWTKFGLTLASYRHARKDFNSLQDRLFLTAKERAEL